MQQTLSLRERGQIAALAAIESAWEEEGRARQRVGTHVERTASAIHAARLKGVVWPQICAVMDNMGRQAARERLRKAGYPSTVPAPRHPSEDNQVALHHLSLAWATEHSAREQVLVAKSDTAAAVAAARQVGVPWRQVYAAVGNMSRPTLLARLAEWSRIPTLTVPEVAQPGGPVPDLAALVQGSWPKAATEWWRTTVVATGAIRGVQTASAMAVAGALVGDQAPQMALRRGSATATKAVHAAATAVTEMAGRSPRADIEEVALVAERAAAAAGAR